MALLILYRERVKRLWGRIVSGRKERVAPSPEPVYREGMRPVETEAALKQLISEGAGVILNDATSAGGESSRVLHAVGCRTLRNARLNAPKLYSEDVEEAVEWLEANRGAEGEAWRRCGICRP
ncbi:MAG: hypothetical protein L0177_17355 [Chloroflexi bacterium]|nr:hypothetical protein [Chloroflexota bacterium]